MMLRKLDIPMQKSIIRSKYLTTYKKQHKRPKYEMQNYENTRKKY